MLLTACLRVEEDGAWIKRGPQEKGFSFTKVAQLISRCCRKAAIDHAK